MFISINQSVETDNDYNRPRCNYHENTIGGKPSITLAFGYVNSLSMSIDEAKRLFLELEVALREAYDDEEVTA